MSNEILNKIGEAAALEQLAEECTELAQSALKLARKIRGENQPPKALRNARPACRKKRRMWNCASTFSRTATSTGQNTAEPSHGNGCAGLYGWQARR